MEQTKDLGQEYERLFAARESALANAEEYDAKGWDHFADTARRRAAGYKAAMTRIRKVWEQAT